MSRTYNNKKKMVVIQEILIKIYEIKKQSNRVYNICEAQNKYKTL